jgi:hypothetical protein
MPGLVPGIHVLFCDAKTWMAETSPAMTIDPIRRDEETTHDRAPQTR